MTLPRAERKTIAAYERAGHSVNGNPAYRFAFTDGTMARSTADAAWCYAVGNPGIRPGCEVFVAYTRAGRIEVLWTAAEWERLRARSAGEVSA